ncbi:MAG: hypothetical protein AAB413_00675 [Patescibacteria group bacterium]
MAKKLFLFLLLTVGVLIGVLVTLWVVSRSSSSTQGIQTVSVSEPSATEPPSLEPDKTTLFGTMLAFNSNEGLGGNPQMQERFSTGWSALRADEEAIRTYYRMLDRAFEQTAQLAVETGFSSNRDVVGAFVWNVIENERGLYDWNLTDATMEAAGKAGMTISAVIQPFASWNQTTYPQEYQRTCKAIDFGYYDYKAGPVTDWEAYRQFLTATVERYDGDGQDDMPGLKMRVEAWEIGNEYDGQCGGYFEDPEGYGELLKTSYEIIKAVDPSALVLNAGALEIIGYGTGPDQTKTFWEDFFAAGYDQFLDVFNFHYNKERNGAQTSPEDWVAHLDFFNGLMEESDGVKPLWVTEFGTYSGTPKSSVPPGEDPSRAMSLPTQSASFQASWFFRYAVIGFASGLERVFIDLEGSDMGGIGASSLYNQGQGKDGEPRMFLGTLQAMAKVLDGFTQAREIDDGQYQFVVGDKTVYALWEGSLPQELQGKTLAVVEIDGEEKTMESDGSAFSQEAPVLVWAQ